MSLTLAKVDMESSPDVLLDMDHHSTIARVEIRRELVGDRYWTPALFIRKTFILYDRGNVSNGTC